MSGRTLRQLAGLLHSLAQANEREAMLFEEHLHPDDAHILAKGCRDIAEQANTTAQLIEDGEFGDPDQLH